MKKPEVGNAPSLDRHDESIIQCLDHTWRTLPQIRTIVGSASSDTELTSALRRLADAGLVERKLQATGAPRNRRGSKLRGRREIEFYRLAVRRAARSR